MSQFQLKEIKSVSYEKADIQKGYTDKSLRINLSSNDIMINPIDEKIKHTFIGGKGYDLWLLWNSVSGTTKWNDPENWFQKYLRRNQLFKKHGSLLFYSPPLLYPVV